MQTYSNPRLDQIKRTFQIIYDETLIARHMWIFMSSVMLLERLRLQQEFDEDYESAANEMNIIFMGTLALAQLYHHQQPVQLNNEEKNENKGTKYPNVDNLIVAMGKEIMHENMPFDFSSFATTFPELLPELNFVHGILNKEPIVLAPPEPLLQIPVLEKQKWQTYEEIKYEVMNGSTMELDELKEDLKIIFARYLKPYTFKFFCFGPNHKNRAKAVLAALQQAPDIETIKEIIEMQQHFMSSVYCDETPQTTVEELERKTGLTERWSTLRNLKNQPDLNKPEKSGYFRMLGFALGRTMGPQIAETAGPDHQWYKGPRREGMY
jgi:hypothetical protein